MIGREEEEKKTPLACLLGVRGAFEHSAAKQELYASLPLYYVDAVLLHLSLDAECKSCSRPALHLGYLPNLFCSRCFAPLFTLGERPAFIERVCAIYRYDRLRPVPFVSRNLF